MKAIFTILILISNLTLLAQSDNEVGDYTLRLEGKENELLEYKLTLNQDGTFFFHYYKYIKNGFPPEENKYGKGKWIEENKVISFFSDKQKDLDEKYTLYFTNTKARFIIKSPRDKTDKIVKTRLQFLESDIFWISRINMLKI
jgi:hypothetical protein